MNQSNSTYVRDQLERYRDVATWRSQARARVDRVRSNLLLILQTALAGGVAWFLDQQLLGHRAPAFAPIAAVISLSAARGQSARRAVELAAGGGGRVRGGGPPGVPLRPRAPVSRLGRPPV